MVNVKLFSLFRLTNMVKVEDEQQRNVLFNKYTNQLKRQHLIAESKNLFWYPEGLSALDGTSNLQISRMEHIFYSSTIDQWESVRVQWWTILVLGLAAKPTERKDLLLLFCLSVNCWQLRFSMIFFKTSSSFYFRNIVFVLLFTEILSVLHTQEPR